MKLSVIIPTYNNEAEITACLQAICTQDNWIIGQDYEIIVVNDGSTDQSAKLIEEFPVKLVQQTNQGRISARQTGTKLAKGVFYLFLDARVKVAKDFLHVWQQLQPYPAVLAGGLQTPTPNFDNYGDIFNWLRLKYYAQHSYPAPPSSHWINPSNFKIMPKGLGAFFIYADLWNKIQPASTNKSANDDTALLATLVYELKINIWRSKNLKWHYQDRKSFKAISRWLFHRGQTFADFYLSTPLVSRTFALIVAFGLVWFIQLNDKLNLLIFPVVFWGILSFINAVYLTFKINQGFLSTWKTLLAIPVFGIIFTTGILLHFFKNKRSTLLGTLVLVFLADYLLANQQQLTSLAQIRHYPQLMFVILVAQVLFQISNGLFLVWLLGLFKLKISIKEGISVAIFSSFANFFMPLQAGLGWRAWYLKKHHNFELTKFGQSLFVSYLIVFQLNASLGLLAWFFLNPARSGLNTLLLLSLVIVWISATVLLILKRSLWLKKIADLWPAILIILTNFLLSSLVYFSLIFATTTNSVNNWNQFITFASWQNLAGVGLLTSLSSFSLLLSITPAALGIREAIFSLHTELLHLPPAQLVGLSLLDRSLMLIVILGLTPLAWWIIKIKSDKN